MKERENMSTDTTLHQNQTKWNSLETQLNINAPLLKIIIGWFGLVMPYFPQQHQGVANSNPRISPTPPPHHLWTNTWIIS